MSREPAPRKKGKKRKLAGVSFSQVAGPSTPGSGPSVSKTTVYHAQVLSDGRLASRRAVTEKPKEEDAQTAGSSHIPGPQQDGFYEGDGDVGGVDVHICPPKKKRTRKWGHDNGVRGCVTLLDISNR